MNKQQQSARDAAWSIYEKCQLGDWSDVTHRNSFDAGYDAAKGESVTVKAEPLVSERDGIVAEILSWARVVSETIRIMADKAIIGDQLDLVKHNRRLIESIKSLDGLTQQPDPATAESTATWKGVDADEFLNEMRREEGDIEYIDQLESTDADKGVCECGHKEKRHIHLEDCDVGGDNSQLNESDEGMCRNCPCQQYKPAQQPEQGEVCENCGADESEHYPDGYDEGVGGCLHFKPATPPASEPSRDAVRDMAKAFGEANRVEGGDGWMLMADFAIHFAGQRAEVAAERAEVAALKIALADAIRCPMGVCPDSAVGLLTVEELKDAENRRIEGKSPAIKHIGLTGEANES